MRFAFHLKAIYVVIRWKPSNGIDLAPFVIQFPRYDRPTCQKRWVYVPPWHYFPSFLYLLSGKSEAMRKCMLSAVFV